MKERILILLILFSTFISAQEIRYKHLSSGLDNLSVFKKNLLEKGYVHLPEHNYEENGELIQLYMPENIKEASHCYYISGSNTFNLKLTSAAMHAKHILILEINQHCIRKEKEYRGANGSMWEEWHCDNDIGIKYKFENNTSSFYFIKFKKNE